MAMHVFVYIKSNSFNYASYLLDPNGAPRCVHLSPRGIVDSTGFHWKMMMRTERWSLPFLVKYKRTPQLQIREVYRFSWRINECTPSWPSILARHRSYLSETSNLLHSYAISCTLVVWSVTWAFLNYMAIVYLKSSALKCPGLFLRPFFSLLRHC